MLVRGRRLTWPVVAATGFVLVGGGSGYAVTRGDDAPDYRTVTAGTGDVDQTLSLSGLVDAARRTDLGFGSDGTLAELKVAVGDRVRAGQVIATLETATLDAAVTEAEAALARSVAQLASDRAAQTSEVQAATNPSGGTDKPSTGSTGNNGNDPGSAADAAVVKELKAQQQAVLVAQRRASAALAAAASALAIQNDVCAVAYGSAEETAAPAASDEQNAACDTALAQVQADQNTVKDAQDALAEALADLGGTLTGALGAVTSGASAARTATDVRTPSSTDENSTGATVTAARLASDQAQIDQARADLIGARADRARTTLRSTRTGRVVSLAVAPGDAVTSGAAVAVVVGGNAVTLTGTVPETSVARVEVGQVARIGVPGSDKTAAGTVTAVAMTADTSSGTTSYPVTITAEDPAIALPAGSQAQVSIVIATAEDVVTVPTSAVTRTGEVAIVRTWDGKELGRVRVTLGAVGARTVAVTDGLEAGTQVVVADVDQEISGASSELVQRGGFGPGDGQVAFRQGGPGGGGPQVSTGK